MQNFVAQAFKLLKLFSRRLFFQTETFHVDAKSEPDTCNSPTQSTTRDGEQGEAAIKQSVSQHQNHN